MGGDLQGKLWPRNDTEKQEALEAGYDLSRPLFIDDLVSGDNCFFAATGITDGDLLHGVRYESNMTHTQSLVMRSKSGTVRLINAQHAQDKLDAISDINYK